MWEPEAAIQELWDYKGRFPTDDEMRSYIKRHLIAAYRAGVEDARDICLRAPLDTDPLRLEQMIVVLKDAV